MMVDIAVIWFSGLRCVRMYPICVIIPIFKVDKYLERCIDSVLAQSFTDFEILLVDDGSYDDCSKICDYYAQLDCRISVIHKANGGLSDARNVGLECVFANNSINWISFIDSDDWIHNKYLEALYQAVINNHCDISSCMFKETNGVEDAVVNDKEFTAKLVDTESFFCEHNVNATIACSKLYKKELFNNIRYPVGRIHEDEFTTYKVLYKNKRIAVIYAPLYFYYINLNGITKQNWNPKRLDSVDAFSNQLNYFRTEGYEKSFIFSLSHMVENIMHQYFVIPKVSENEKYFKILRIRLRKHLRLCRKYNMFKFQNNRHIYEVAYPVLMRYYWRYQVFKSRMRREKNG